MRCSAIAPARAATALAEGAPIYTQEQVRLQRKQEQMPEQMTEQMQELKQLCGAPVRSRGWGVGAPCERQAGECPFHAPLGSRCQSVLVGEPDAKCYNVRTNGCEHCAFHAGFPILGLRLRDFAKECGDRPVYFADFLRQHCSCAASAGRVSLEDVRAWRRLVAHHSGAAPETSFAGA